jgi:peroxiredoxin
MEPVLAVGQQLPELQALTPEGAATLISTRFGLRKTLLFFMHGTWCPPCVGQLHLLQRYLPKIEATGADIIVLVNDDLETLQTFLTSAVPTPEYTVLSDPKRSAYQQVGIGSDTVVLIVNNQGLIRWLVRWPDHQQEPGYEVILQALRAVVE